MNHPEVKHGKIRLAFTPDEEIGTGAEHFDVKDFGADLPLLLMVKHLVNLTGALSQQRNLVLIFKGLTFTQL